MQHTILLGAQWGDEGKGRIVDLLSRSADVVCRFQGGHNAGHTLVVDGQTLVLHLLPSGILHQHVNCCIASGTVVSLASLAKELAGLRALNIDYADRVHLSLDAHLILPYHIRLDTLREQQLAPEQTIGTTGSGIGPAYEDKAARRGIRVCDLCNIDDLRAKIDRQLALYNHWFVNIYAQQPLDIDAVLESIMPHLTTIQPLICDVKQRLFAYATENKRLLFEGAQGALLDVAHGSYPFVTSSHTTVGGALVGTGFGKLIGDTTTIGVAKAYVTRVGNGVLPTQLSCHIGQHLATKGHEFGATTGRARRCGWLDLVALRSVVRDNHMQALCITKLDVLDGLETLQVCDTYRMPDGSRHRYLQEGLNWSQVTPEYTPVATWHTPSHGVTEWQMLPPQAQAYITLIEQQVGVPVAVVSTGPERNHAIIRDQTLIC